MLQLSLTIFSNETDDPAQELNFQKGSTLATACTSKIIVKQYNSSDKK